MRREGGGVFVDGLHSGAITRSRVEEGGFLFSYDAGCADDRVVSLTMPVMPDQYDSMGFLHPIFEMNLPEGVLRQKLESMFAKAIKNFDALALLEIVGKSQIGRLRYAAEGSFLEDVPVESIDKLLAYNGAADFFNALMERFAAYSGISGMQPKVLVRDVVAGVDKITNTGATHIVKSFDPKEYPELAANEYFSMQAARHAGLPTALTYLSENRSMLVADRFDRPHGETFLGFEDFCVLSGMRSNGRYSSSYEALAKNIARYVSPQQHQAAMRQLFGTVALACVIKNGDAHLKNFGILYDKPGVNVRLAPVYDMLSTAPYMPKDILALELQGSKQYPGRKQLIRFARASCGLSSQVVAEVLGEVENGVEAALDEMAIYAKARPDFKPTADYLTRVFRHGLEGLASRSGN